MLKEYFDTDLRNTNATVRNFKLLLQNSSLRVTGVSNEISLRNFLPTQVSSFGRPGFDTASRKISISNSAISSKEQEIVVSGHYEPSSLTKFLSFYIPACDSPDIWCLAVLHVLDIALATTVDFISSCITSADDPSLASSRHLFIGRVFIYCDNYLATEQRHLIYAQADSLGIKLQLRDKSYSEKRQSLDKPLAFISHDSRDKEEIALRIATGLRRMACTVWYDDFSLKVGDSLRESIERGLRECHKCILILTPNFLSNPGWTTAEFNAIFTRELIEQRKIILPVWCDITKSAVFEYSPILADKVALKWSLGEEKVISELYQAILK